MMRFFHKKDMGKRVMSMVLAIVMVFTMFAAELPGSLLTVKAAEGDTNITVHFDNSEWNWETPALQYWGGSATLSGYADEPTAITGWGGAMGYHLQNDGDGWYSITLKGNFGGFQFLEMEENEKLPAVREVARELAINPNTVQKTYQKLEFLGLIYLFLYENLTKNFCDDISASILFIVCNLIFLFAILFAYNINLIVSNILFRISLVSPYFSTFGYFFNKLYPYSTKSIYF